LEHNAIEARNLTKVYTTKKSKEGGGFLAGVKSLLSPETTLVRAVDNVDLSIGEGEIFGLLGPNGAGKTTTVKMLCTVIEPTSGQASVAGFDVVKQADKVREQIGAVLEGERALYWKLTGRENLEFYSTLYHVPPRIAKKRTQELIEFAGLKDWADQMVEKYSKGMKQRLTIMKALVHNPPILLLDEPTLGLDPVGSREIREKIVQMKKEGHTILLTTHYMQEADELCDRVGIMDHGKLIALGTPKELKDSIKKNDIIEVELSNFSEERFDGLRKVGGTIDWIVHTWMDQVVGKASVKLQTPDGRAVLPDIVRLSTELGMKVEYVKFSEPSLEDVFVSLTGRKLSEGAPA
jgi:ABC-2 type transport system ATP-binding protein